MSTGDNIMSMLNIAKSGSRNEVFDILSGLDHDMAEQLHANEYFSQQKFDYIFNVLREIGKRGHVWLDDEMAPIFVRCCQHHLRMEDISEGVLRGPGGYVTPSVLDKQMENLNALIKCARVGAPECRTLAAIANNEQS
jgi:hypothetical protein